MCDWGTCVDLNVPISRELSRDGNSRWDKKSIDQCLAPLVDALNKAGIYTASSCCGHGKEFGHIWLQDGRVLIILPENTNKDNVFEITRKAE